jgi:hypothetical protein
MSIQFQPPSLIGAQSAHTGSNPFLDRFSAARAAGAIMLYDFKSVKPKKRLKEIIKVLMPEKKTFLKFPYKFKYNLKDRCVVCGSQKIWEAGDSMRPPLPLHKVRKGYPMRGTYCEKHSQIHRQYEMLEQQILADEHGLSFSAYIPSVKNLNPLSSGPLLGLKQIDIQSLSSLGWSIHPPSSNSESKEEELFRLIIENNGINERIKTLLTEGAKVVSGSEQEEVE